MDLTSLAFMGESERRQSWAFPSSAWQEEGTKQAKVKIREVQTRIQQSLSGTEDGYAADRVAQSCCAVSIISAWRLSRPNRIEH